MTRPGHPARVDEVIERLESMANPANVAGMARFGIRPRTRVLGISVVALRKLAREIGSDHALAGALWRSGIHEARLLATMVDDPAKVTEEQADRWVRTLDSWDICDQLCGNLLDRTPFAVEKALEWSRCDPEFEKRAAFALMASLALQGGASERTLERFLPVIRREATDDRNFVKKAVNWALRQIGKRSDRTRAGAIATAERIAAIDSRPARWIASDALRELRAIPPAKRSPAGPTARTR
jgi:3-methyladenine DNA glycosylase AlkD